MFGGSSRTPHALRGCMLAHSRTVGERAQCRACVDGRTFVEPARPTQMAHTSELFPEPLGPRMRLSLGPGVTMQWSYVMKFRTSILHTLPFANSGEAANSSSAKRKPVVASTASHEATLEGFDTINL